MSRYIDVISYDGVILEFDPNLSAMLNHEDLRKKIEKELNENGVAVLPKGVKVVVVRRDKCVVKGDIDEPIH